MRTQFARHLGLMLGISLAIPTLGSAAPPPMAATPSVDSVGAVAARSARLARPDVRRGVLAAAATASAMATSDAGIVLASTPVGKAYGSGVSADSKNNYQIGSRLDLRVSHRFRPTSKAPIVSIAINERGGSGYSGGTGGSIRIALQLDRNGAPSGTDLASVTFATPVKAGHWERKVPHKVSGWPAMDTTRVYHLVFTNPLSTRATNYISINEVTRINDRSTPKSPAFGSEFAVLVRDRDTGWRVMADTPVMDVAHSDGRHDGNAFFSPTLDHYAVIRGSSRMVRERFKVSGPNRTITEIAVRLKRISGSGSVRIRLEDSAGRVIVTATRASTGIPLSPLPVEVNGRWSIKSISGSRWLGIRVPATVLRSGLTYQIRVSTDSRTTLATIPIRPVIAETGVTWGSWQFADGVGQKTTDGRTWVPMYRWSPHDLQFFLR